MSLESFSFDQSKRISDRAGYSRVFAKITYSRKNAYFSTFARPSGEQGARLGIVVAKKNVRLAVDRSRIKRVIRESFRRQQSSLAGYDLVVVVKKGFSKAPQDFFSGLKLSA